MPNHLSTKQEKKTSPHLLCHQKASIFIQVFEGRVVPVPLQLDSQRKIQIGKNRHVLVQILKLLHRLGKQNIAIRGKTDKQSNFNVFLNAQAEHDHILREHLERIQLKQKASRTNVQGSYISHRIQNKLIGIMGDYLEQSVLNRIKKVQSWLMNAETVLVKKNWPFFFRYVWYDEETNTFSVHEDFVCFLHCERTSGEELFKVLMGGEDGGYMGRNQIPLQNGRGQGYDGAGNMTGLHNGLQARVCNLYPKMHFHWCSGHCLNLFLAKACEKVKKVVDHVQETGAILQRSYSGIFRKCTSIGQKK